MRGIAWYAFKGDHLARRVLVVGRLELGDARLGPEARDDRVLEAAVFDLRRARELVRRAVERALERHDPRFRAGHAAREHGDVLAEGEAREARRQHVGEAARQRELGRADERTAQRDGEVVATLLRRPPVDDARIAGVERAREIAEHHLVDRATEAEQAQIDVPVLERGANAARDRVGGELARRRRAVAEDHGLRRRAAVESMRRLERRAGEIRRAAGRARGEERLGLRDLVVARCSEAVFGERGARAVAREHDEALARVEIADQAPGELRGLGDRLLRLAVAHVDGDRAIDLLALGRGRALGELDVEAHGGVGAAAVVTELARPRRVRRDVHGRGVGALVRELEVAVGHEALGAERRAHAPARRVDRGRVAGRHHLAERAAVARGDRDRERVGGDRLIMAERQRVHVARAAAALGERLVVREHDLARALRWDREDLERERAARRPLEEGRIARAHGVVDDALEDARGALALDDLTLDEILSHPQREARQARAGRHGEAVRALERARRRVRELLLDLGAREAFTDGDGDAVAREAHTLDDAGRPGDARRERAEAAWSGRCGRGALALGGARRRLRG